MSVLEKLRIWRKHLRVGELSSDAMAESLMEYAMTSALKTHKDTAFRQAVQWESLETGWEHVMLRELVVTALCVSFFVVDDSIKYLPGDKREYWRAVQPAIALAVFTFMQQGNIAEEKITLWREFIALRQETVRYCEEAMYSRYGEKLKRLSMPDREKIVRVMSIEITCHIQVCPRETKPATALEDYLERWIGDLDRHYQLCMRGV